MPSDEHSASLTRLSLSFHFSSIDQVFYTNRAGELQLAHGECVHGGHRPVPTEPEMASARRAPRRAWRWRQLRERESGPMIRLSSPFNQSLYPWDAWRLRSCSARIDASVSGRSRPDRSRPGRIPRPQVGVARDFRGRRPVWYSFSGGAAGRWQSPAWACPC